MSLPSEQFDEEYFERGLATGKSLYTDYRWLPEVSIPIAMTIKRLFPGKSILDYGCAKGFLVHALRSLGVEAYGYDVSRYAIEHCKQEAREFICMRKNLLPKVDVVVGKDVLEHIPYAELVDELCWIAGQAPLAFFVVPLGEHGQYRIAEYGKDKSHVIVENSQWWMARFREAGFFVEEFSFACPGLKDHWTNIEPKGNGFFWLSRAST